MNENVKVIYEWHGKYNAVVIWQVGQRGSVAYAWMLIPTGAEPPGQYPEKACLYTRFMQAWRDGCFEMEHKRGIKAAA